MAEEIFIVKFSSLVFRVFMMTIKNNKKPNEEQEPWFDFY